MKVVPASYLVDTNKLTVNFIGKEKNSSIGQHNTEKQSGRLNTSTLTIKLQ